MNKTDSDTQDLASTVAMRDRILSAATDLFLMRGYDSVTLDEIVRNARVSKTSIYKAFGSKEDLLRAVIAESGLQTVSAAFDHPDADDIRTTMHELGVRYVVRMLDKRTLAIMRLCLALTTRFPEVGRHFLDEGPNRCTRRAAEAIRRWHDGGLIESADHAVTAAYFLQLLRARHQFEALCDSTYEISRDEIDRHVSGVVEFMLRSPKFGNG